MTVIGKYVNTFAEASHALPEGMHMNADYPFKLPTIKSIAPKCVTLEGERGDTIDAKILNAGGREYCEIRQSSTFETFYRKRPTKFRCYPFKDENTSAIGVVDNANPQP